VDDPTRVVYSTTKKMKIYLLIINTVNKQVTCNAYLLRKQPLILFVLSILFDHFELTDVIYHLRD